MGISFERLNEDGHCFDKDCFFACSDAGGNVVDGLGGRFATLSVERGVLDPSKVFEVRKEFVFLRSFLVRDGKKDSNCFCCRCDEDLFMLALDQIPGARIGK